MLSIWLVSITCVTWLVDVELLVGVTWGHLQCQGQNNVPLGMPGTQTVGGHTINCSGGDIPPSSLVIRALQYTVNTTNKFNAAVDMGVTPVLKIRLTWDFSDSLFRLE